MIDETFERIFRGHLITGTFHYFIFCAHRVDLLTVEAEFLRQTHLQKIICLVVSLAVLLDKKAELMSVEEPALFQKSRNIPKVV